MKKEYTIGQICKLYDLGADSLRYYEKKGILKPFRKENGYRVYGLEHIFRLNIIKDLRKLGFSIKQIKEYLEKRNLNSTINLIQSEINLVNKEIKLMEDLKMNLQEKLNTLKQLEEINNTEKIEIKKLEKRKIILIDTPNNDSDEIDLAFRKLEGQRDDKLYLLGNKNMGVFLSRKSVENKNYSVYSHAFFFVKENSKNYDAIISKGDFISLTYKGNYAKSTIYFEEMMKYMNENNYRLKGPPMEIYRVDIHETEVEDEFVTELQLPVEKIKRG